MKSNGMTWNEQTQFEGNDIGYSEIMLLNDDALIYSQVKLIFKELLMDIVRNNIDQLIQSLDSMLR
jgi:hypothetical protein